MCSCSGHVTPENFLEMLLGVGHETGRDLQLLEVRGAQSSRDDRLPGERISEVRDLPRRLGVVVAGIIACGALWRMDMALLGAARGLRGW